MNYKKETVDLRYLLFLKIKSGIKAIKENKKKQSAYFCFWIVVLILWLKRDYIWCVSEMSALNKIGFYSWFILLVFITGCGILLVYGQLLESIKYNRKLNYIGMKNSTGEIPIMFFEKIINDEKKMVVFKSRGVTIDEWVKRAVELENVFNAKIIKIEIGKAMDEVCILIKRGIFNYKEKLLWQDEYLCIDEPTLYLGRGIQGDIILPLGLYPHVLIGGGTGSGKTVLLKSLLYQSIMLKFDVIIADFKGGVDYPSAWRDRCIFVDDRKRLMEKLEFIIVELEKRKKIFVETESKNIDEYNHYQAPKELNRIIFACDEVAELFDTSGMDKAEKEEIKKIVAMVSTIARLGRAFGIHLILATQRPDADVMSGQIKNNIPYRICGRADSVLSKIILDNTEASKQIPNDIQSVFMNQNGEIFKGFYMEGIL